MIGLFNAVAASCDFGEFARLWAGEVEGEFGDELMTICHISGQLIVQKGAGKVEISNLQAVEAATV